MDDLVQFLRARLDEDERTARRATEGPWTIRNLGRHDLSTVVKGNVLLAQLDGSQAGANSVHMAIHNPARVLREVEAKRGMIEAHGPRKLHPELGGSYQQAVLVCRSCGPSHFPKRLASHHLHPCRTLRLLALPYADHPGYRPEWRP